MPKDFLDTINAMASRPERITIESGLRLKEYYESGRLSFVPHPFWNSGKFFSEIPEDICLGLRSASLTFIKGDANYRRPSHQNPDFSTLFFFVLFN